MGDCHARSVLEVSCLYVQLRDIGEHHVRESRSLLRSWVLLQKGGREVSWLGLA